MAHDDYRTLLQEVREWVIERNPAHAADLDALDARLRQRLGTQRVYVPRQSKRDRLRALAELPPDASPDQRAKAAGLQPRQARELWRLLGR